ncbi:MULTISPECIES: hypothetical protein [unclassified Streptomyces]|uniref:hypothetical protein n=1 Tax=unclassified Streptomyces TaxID=2593676 RepID=UPI00362F403B
MRLPLSRRFTTAAVCAALALGTVAPAVARELPRDTGTDTAPVSAPDPAPGSTAPSAPAAPVRQTKPSDDVSNVLKPVADLVQAALKAPGGELSAADIEKHTKAIRDAVAALKAAAPADALAEVVATVQKSTDSLAVPAPAADPRQP